VILKAKRKIQLFSNRMEPHTISFIRFEMLGILDLYNTEFVHVGYVKNIDHAENLWHCESPARENLCCCSGITQDMFACTRDEIEYRVVVCRATNCAYIRAY
jgi:hypothetical protein